MTDRFTTIKHILRDVLSLGDKALDFTPATPLLGSLPEFDSMAVVSVITALEERFPISIDDEEISAEIFATVGSLDAFVADKLGA
ncbi:MAG: acyl carrier protein [Gammaproteobacteria bacterium]|nr:acyl carrier protein [Gammaproteobacteria bacterium]